MTDDLLSWVFAAFVFCGFAWLAFREAVRAISHLRSGRVAPADLWRALPALLLTAVMTAGILWFLLWMLTAGRVPHGLWGFGLAASALLCVVVVDSRKR